MSRREKDFYETAPWMTRALLANVPEIRGRVFEPCCGDGSIANVLHDYMTGPFEYLSVCTNDLDETRKAYTHADASDLELWQYCGRDYFDWVITNPPYEMPTCLEIVQHAYEYARVGIAMMLRLSFKEPTAHRNPRGPWLAEHPITRELVMPRYSFTGNGKSDSVTTAWMLWSKEPLSGPAHLSLYRANEIYGDKVAA